MIQRYGQMGNNYLIEKKTLWEKEELLITSNFFFSFNVSKSHGFYVSAVQVF